MVNGNVFLAFLAGLLTTLSPCVLPVLPFVTASSFNSNRWGPLALSLGLLITFVSATMILSISGSLFGYSQDHLKIFSGVLLALSGSLFLISSWSEKVTTWLGAILPSGSPAASDTKTGNALGHEFLNGLFLGLAWAPCSGPSLGSAIGLASQAGGFWPALFLLWIFGCGAILPMLIFAYGTKSATISLKKNIQWIGKAKKGLGLLMVLFGLLIATGYDHVVEAKVTQWLPAGWVEMTSRY